MVAIARGILACETQTVAMSQGAMVRTQRMPIVSEVVIGS